MKFSKRSLNNLVGLHPDLVLVMKEAIKDSPVDFTITDGIRTTKEQQDLFAKGRTELGNIVTYADGVKSKSNHQVKADGFGYAVDLYPYYNGKVQLSDKGVPAKQLEIANHIKEVANKLGISIVWGGDWKGKKYDPPHFELKK